MIVPTYGRAARQPEILNECVYWLLKQTYKHLEILIVNDAKNQMVVFDHPKVRIINHHERFHCLGCKMNYSLFQAKGDILMCAEDDDISLPHRAEQAVGKLEGHEYWNPGLWVYAPQGEVAVIDGNGYGHNCSAYRAGKLKYDCMILGHDKNAAIWAAANLRCNPNRVRPKEVSYIYRWGVSHLHLSGAGDPQRAWNEFNPGKPGRYELKPQPSRVDWIKERDAAAEICPF